MKYAVAFRFRKKEYFAESGGQEALTFGSHKNDQIQMADAADHLLTLTEKNGILSIVTRPPLLGSRTINFNEIDRIEGVAGTTIYASMVTGWSGMTLNLPYKGELTCGRQADNDIILSYPIVSGHHFRLTMEGGRVHVQDLDSTNHLYLNGKKIVSALMKSGDVLSIYTFRFLLENGVLYFENMGNGVRFSDRLKNPARNRQREQEQEQIRPIREPLRENVPQRGGDGKGAYYLAYHLSPRRREQLPKEPILLSNAPGAMTGGGGRRGNMAYLLSTGAMMAIGLATGTLTPAMLLTRAACMISPLANMAMYSKMSKEEKAQIEEYERLRHESYQAYIADQKARIAKIADIQRRVITKENPAPEQCVETVEKLRRSLWERMPSDDDFLRVRLGIGRERLCVEVKARTDTEGFSMSDDDELEQLSAQIIEETRYVDNIPVCVSLREKQTVGLIGERAPVTYQLRSILTELTSEHSFRDVRLVGMFDEDMKNIWGVLRWLPHIWDESEQARYIAFDAERRHTVSELLADVIRRRTLRAEEAPGRRKEAVLPHYVVLVEHREQLLSESIYDDLVANNSALGISTIFLAEQIYDLPQTCQVIVDLTERPCVYEREKYDDRTFFVQDEPVHTIQMEHFARRMAAIELENKDVGSAIPTAVTFLQGYGVRTVEELNAAERWERSDVSRTLAAPIGVMEGGKVFEFDIQDQVHGPHGLLAGTTGSGKSEFLQSWILSMAVNYHPHDVNFVIIDYKGGGMSDLMEPLPHVVGKITNIDRNISRSLVSLKSELKRRQELFARAGVNNIQKYQKKYHNGEAKEPLPYLILVTDEFAELKKEEPEFMAELNSVATIGRTLGIRMLLATQKPAGVVTDIMSANSHFRICMKVQDVADSREMLKRPDAARITQAGRAYIRVGEDEIFELFQSFYSAAEYVGDETSRKGMQMENQVRIVGVTGERINPVKKKKREQTGEDELTAVTRYLNEICEARGIEKLPGPWLPELPRMLTFAELGVSSGFTEQGWVGERKGLSVPVGRYDVPQRQAQGVLWLDFYEVGHFGVYGMPGSGKTMFLKAVLTGLCRYYTPKEVNIYALDANSWSLSDFRGMPQVREVILSQNEKAIHHFTLSIVKELEKRKQLFLKYAVNSLKAYQDTVARDLPAIVVAVDNISMLMDDDMELAAALTAVASIGAAYGVFLIYTNNSSSGLYKLQQLVKGAVALQMPERGDYAVLVGSVNGGISLPNFPGRALFRGNPPVAFQTILYMDGEEEKERHDVLLALEEQMNKIWAETENPACGEQPGLRPQGEVQDINTGGEKIDGESKFGGESPASGSPGSSDPQDEGIFRFFPEGNSGSSVSETRRAAYQNRTRLPLGEDTESLELVWMDLTAANLLLISSDSADINAKAIDQFRRLLAERADNQVEELSAEGLPDLIEKLEKRRKDKKQKKKEPGFDEQEWLAGFSQICILIPDLPAFSAQLSEKERSDVWRIFTKSAGLGVTFFAAGDRKALIESESDQAVQAAIQRQNVLAFGGCPADHKFARTNAADVGTEILLEPEEAAWMWDGTLTVMNFR